MNTKFGPLLAAIVSITLFLFALGQNAMSATGSTNFSVGLVIGNAGDTTTRYTCGAARTKISLSGFSNVKALECNGDLYLFSAGTKKTILLHFDAASGDIKII